jgi:hypothetical protein
MTTQTTTPDENINDKPDDNPNNYPDDNSDDNARYIR